MQCKDAFFLCTMITCTRARHEEIERERIQCHVIYRLSAVSISNQYTHWTAKLSGMLWAATSDKRWWQDDNTAAVPCELTLAHLCSGKTLTRWNRSRRWKNCGIWRACNESGHEWELYDDDDGLHAGVWWSNQSDMIGQKYVSFIMRENLSNANRQITHHLIPN